MADRENTVWELPEPVSVHEVQVDAETRILLRQHGNPAGPRLILSHGNGLAIDLYYPFWSLLADEFDLIVYDLRNHGWNSVSSLSHHTVPTLIADHDAILEAIDRHYGEKTQVGVFHSVSALVSLLSPIRGGRFAGLMLFDPPVAKEGHDLQTFEEATIRAASTARSRTAKFRSVEQFAGVLPLLPAFQRFVPGACDLLARTTMRESDDGNGYVLRCPPEYEAQLMGYGRVYAAAVDFDSLDCPVKALGADPTLPFSYLPSLDLSDILTVDYDFLPEATHFLQVEQPEQCAAATLEFLEAIGVR